MVSCMKMISVYLALFFAFIIPGDSFAAINPVVPSVFGVGMGIANAPATAYFQIPPTATPIFLSCGSNAATSASTSSPCRKGGAAFQVTASKRLTCIAGTVHSDTVGTAWQFVHATATFADNTASPTGAVYETGATGTAGLRQFTGPVYQQPLTDGYEFPATTSGTGSGGFFPGVNVTAGSIRFSVTMICFEQT